MLDQHRGGMVRLPALTLGGPTVYGASSSSTTKEGGWPPSLIADIPVFGCAGILHSLGWSHGVVVTPPGPGSCGPSDAVVGFGTGLIGRNARVDSPIGKDLTTATRPNSFFSATRFAPIGPKFEERRGSHRWVGTRSRCCNELSGRRCDWLSECPFRLIGVAGALAFNYLGGMRVAGPSPITLRR